LALESLDEGFNLTPDALHARFARHAPALATEAAQRALENAAISSSDVDALQVSTCTGYLCPGLTSYVADRLAAIPNLRTAEALVASGRAKVVLSVCVEVCSAAFYLDDDPGVLISACLFGDGAGAAVLAGEPGANRRIAWRSADSHLDPSVRECLRFETRDGMLRNILGAEVPAIAARQVTRLLHESLANSNLRLEDISGWIVHPGGRDVLTAIHREVGLPETALKRSADILKEYGNLSSPSVLFVLQRALAEDAPGGHWWMTSFGAGFSCHGALLEVSET
jgi:alkylresorcinol/alkylpyrone synthase